MDIKSKLYLATPDASLSRLVRGVVEDSGYRVQEAMDWSMIVEEVAIFGADMVMLDKQIPGAVVLDLVRRLQTDKRTADKKVVVILAPGQEDQIAGYFEAGASDIFLQPLVGPLLVHRLDVLTHPPAMLDIDLDPMASTETMRSTPSEDDVTDPGRRVAAGIGKGLPDGLDGFYESDLGVLIEVSEAMASSLPTSDALYVLVRRISQAIEVDRCNVVVLGVKHHEAFVVASHDDGDLRRHQVDLARYPEVRRCLGSGETVLIHDVRKDPEMERVMDLITAIDLRSALVLPLYVHEKVVGTLSLTTRRETHGFTRRELLLLRAMANMAAGLLSTSRLLSEVRQAAAAEKPPIEEFDEVVLDINDQIEGLMEEIDHR